MSDKSFQSGFEFPFNLCAASDTPNAVLIVDYGAFNSFVIVVAEGQWVEKISLLF